jgi:hypothetical protein
MGLERRTGIATDSVFGVELVGDVAVVLSG